MLGLTGHMHLRNSFNPKIVVLVGEWQLHKIVTWADHCSIGADASANYCCNRTLTMSSECSCWQLLWKAFASEQLLELSSEMSLATLLVMQSSSFSMVRFTIVSIVTDRRVCVFGFLPVAIGLDIAVYKTSEDRYSEQNVFKQTAELSGFWITAMDWTGALELLRTACTSV